MVDKTDRQRAFEEAWEGWIRPVLMIAGAGAVAGAHMLGWLSSLATAGIVAALFVLLAVAGNTARTVTMARGRALRVALGVTGALATLLTVSEMWMALSPGAPDATAVFEETGASMTVPSVPGGRVVVEATPFAHIEHDGRQVAFHLGLEGSGGRQSVGERFRLASGASNPRQRGGGQSEFLATSFLLQGLGDGVTVKLTSMEPAGVVRLRVSVYAHPVPMIFVAGGLLLLALLVAAFESRVRLASASTYLTIGVATAAAFGFLTRAGIAPANAVMALLGRLLLAGVIGGISGSVLPWLMRRLRPLPAV